MAEEPEEIIKIGGPGKRVHVDETAICNELFIHNPSSEDDNNPAIQWIIGGVVQGNCREFFVELIPNRKWKTIERVFNKYIIPGSVIVTDGYTSYPRAVSSF